MSESDRTHETKRVGALAKPQVNSTAPALLAGVVKDRVERVIQQAQGARVVYAIVDLGKQMTSAIGEAVATIRPNRGQIEDRGRIEVAIDHELARDGLDPSLLSDDVATRFRNRSSNGIVATIFSVPNSQAELVIQSLGSVQRINEAWLCDPTRAEAWTARTLPHYDGLIPKQLTQILAGLMNSEILASAEMLAEFCFCVQECMLSRGYPLSKSINFALPYLRIPRNSMPDIRPDHLAEKPHLSLEIYVIVYSHIYISPQKRANFARVGRCINVSKHCWLMESFKLIMGGHYQH